MRRVGRVAVIVAAGAVLGFGWNAVGPRGLALSSNAYIKPGEDVVEIDAAEAKKRLDHGALFLDARPVAFYGMGHIPGALPLPEDDFDRAFASLEPRLRNTLDLVVYCSGYGCEASHIVARKLREKGIHAAILHEGWPAWNDAGYPTKEGKEP
jgi:rhodanese-related sulfurtransferase